MDVIRWMLDPDTTAAVTWIGTIAGVIALYATYRQAKGARTAAEAATHATQALEGRITLSNLGYAHTQVVYIKSLVQTNELRAAYMTFDLFRRTVLQTCRLLSARPGMERKIEVVRRNLKTIATQLDYGERQHPQYELKKLLAALRGVSEFLEEQEHELTFGPQGN
jgi:hypothetical protein